MTMILSVSSARARSAHAVSCALLLLPGVIGVIGVRSRSYAG
jgi:hypothetical protein